MTYINRDILLSSHPTADIVEYDITESSIGPILKQMSDSDLQLARTRSQERAHNVLRVVEDLYALHLKVKEVRDVIGYDAFTAVPELRQMATTAEHYYNKYKLLHQKEEAIIMKALESEIGTRNK